VEGLVAEPPAVVELICCCANVIAVAIKGQTARRVSLFICRLRELRVRNSRSVGFEFLLSGESLRVETHFDRMRRMLSPYLLFLEKTYSPRKLSRMESRQPSRTALAAATYRAAHQVLDGGRIFADPLALRILGLNVDSIIRGQDDP
jgi:hypothetical protein